MLRGHAQSVAQRAPLESLGPSFRACLPTAPSAPCLHRMVLNSRNPATIDALNARSSTGGTPLHMAVAKGQMGMVDLLLNHDGIDRGACDGAGNSTINIACQRQDVRLLQQLLSTGRGVSASELSVRNNLGWAPLHTASFRGQDTAVRLLLRWLAPVDVRAPDESCPSPAVLPSLLGSIHRLTSPRRRRPTPTPSPPLSMCCGAGTHHRWVDCTAPRVRRRPCPHRAQPPRCRRIDRPRPPLRRVSPGPRRRSGSAGGRDCAADFRSSAGGTER